MELKYKIAYAEYERQQEEAAYMTKLQRDLALEKRNEAIKAQTAKKVQFTSKAQVIKEFRTKLSTNRAWVERGIVRVFENQTKTEQSIGFTKDWNGIGFTGADSRICTSFANQIIRGKNLSDKQLAIAFKIMPKYATQLVNGSLAEGKIKKNGKVYEW